MQQFSRQTLQRNHIFILLFLWSYIFNDPRWNPNGNTKRRDILVNNRPSTNCTALSNRHSRQNRSICTNPTVIANDDFPSKLLSPVCSPRINFREVLTRDDIDIRAYFNMVSDRDESAVEDS